MARNKKKQLYDLYYSLNGFLFNQLNTKGKKEVDAKDMLAKYVGFLWEQNDRSDTATKVECTAAVEWDYITAGSPAVFPESLDLLEKLFHSKYLFKDDFKLVFPFDTFQVAIPRGFEINGVKIPPFIVNIGHFNQLLENKKELFKAADLEGSNNHPQEVIEANERFIQISISGGKKNLGQNAFCQIRESMLPLAVKSRNSAEYAEYMRKEQQNDKEKGYHDNALDMLTKDKWGDGQDEGTIIEFSILKIIAVLSIYLSATENIYLKKGLPGSHLPSISMVERLDKPLPFLLRQTDTIKKLSNNRSPEEHYRVFHFRNLKAAQYYQGEYADLIPGSRWVFVKDAIVNGKTKGFTPIETSIPEDLEAT